jgi:hypothetical protein
MRGDETLVCLLTRKRGIDWQIVQNLVIPKLCIAVLLQESSSQKSTQRRIPKSLKQRKSEKGNDPDSGSIKEDTSGKDPTSGEISSESYPPQMNHYLYTA